MNDFASRLARVRPSAIIALTQRARELAATGRDPIDLGIGEPDLDTPDNVKQAAIESIRRGETKYTDIHGSADLRDAIRAKFKRDNGLEYSRDQITVAGGAKLIIFNAMMATLDPGDEVIIPAPYWTSYPDVIRIAEGEPVFVTCPQEHGFKLRARDLEAAITPRTRWLLLNSPSNPTGSAYRREDLEALGEVLITHERVRILTDDIYEHLIYDGFEFATMAQAVPALAGRTLTVNGVSKAYAMTGWRLGYAAGPAELIAAMGNVQQQSSTHASSITQAATLEALAGPQTILDERRALFRQRRDVVVDALDAIDGLSCFRPDGTFFAFPSCAGLIGRRTPDGRAIETDRDLVVHLLESEHVATVPGAAFGLSPHFRVSFATSTQRLQEACTRIAHACAALT
jgi:aspartate aminotransferase